ncbi:MAG: 4-hydroxythreonine-4-phosphate dehydrogenase PdxA [Alphaproteobacteria bacterium]
MNGASERAHGASPPLALTMGEPAGIGPEITVKAWAERRRGVPPFVYLGPAGLLRDTARMLGLDVPVQEVAAPGEAVPLFPRALPVLNLPLAAAPRPGRPEARNADAVTQAIARAVSLTLEGRTRAVVTNPIQKSVLKQAGFAYPGHTEYLGALAMKAGAENVRPVMMLAAPELRVVPVTIHMPLRDVPGALRTDDIIETGVIAAAALRERFGISAPRLAVSGLNPHAGEGGALGTEDEAVIAPAVAALKARGIDVRGPLPADTMFHASARARYDAALCMYHDQALIPVKALAFEEAVNVTLGLPFIRTSPDHGTALDIAGKGVARADNLIAALKLAGKLSAAEKAASRVSPE